LELTIGSSSAIVVATVTVFVDELVTLKNPSNPVKFVIPIISSFANELLLSNDIVALVPFAVTPVTINPLSICL
jgi:hypothetical protein